MITAEDLRGTTSRARGIVKLAAAEGEDDYTREWLLTDERGIWEKEALRLLGIGATAVTVKGLTDAEIDRQCAAYIRMQALTAQINHERKRKP